MRIIFLIIMAGIAISASGQGPTRIEINADHIVHSIGGVIQTGVIWTGSGSLYAPGILKRKLI